MAYGNWGAFVYRNGERMREWEDATPYKERVYSPGYHQAFGVARIYRAEDGTVAVDKRQEDDLRPQHAVLGDQRVRLCGYKYVPRLFVDGKVVDLDQYGLAASDEPWTDAKGAIRHDFKEFMGDLCLDGAEYRIHAVLTDNFVDLELEQPDGVKWTARCGYAYGAGHMD